MYNFNIIELIFDKFKNIQLIFLILIALKLDKFNDIKKQLDNISLINLTLIVLTFDKFKAVNQHLF